MRKILASLLMALSITHTTPSDATFSASGSAAWNENHTVAGLAAIATSGAYADITGTPNIFSFVAVTGQSTVAATGNADTIQIVAGTGMAIVTDAAAKSMTLTAVGGSGLTLADVYPVGSIYISTSSVNPGTTFGIGTWVLTSKGKAVTGLLTGDADFGTVGATGGAKTVAASGTVSTPVFTGDAYTPSGTLDLTLYIAKGTNAPAAFTPSGAITWPTGVPTFSGTSVQATASVNWPAGVPTFSGTSVQLSASVNWPAGVPTFSGTAHQHESPVIHTGTGNTAIYILPTSTFGVGSTNRVPTVQITSIGSNATSTNLNTLAGTTGTGVALLVSTATAAGVISWPASVPQAVGSASAAGVISWPASVPQAVVSASAAGVISWPATAPTFSGGAGTVPAQVFAGTAGSGSGLFTGVGKSPTGTISKPTFTGDATSVLQPFMVFYIWERTA